MFFFFNMYFNNLPAVHKTTVKKEYYIKIRKEGDPLRKILKTTALILAFIFVFSGCNKQTETDEEENPLGFSYEILDFVMVADEIYKSAEISDLTLGSVDTVTNKTTLEEQYYLDLKKIEDYEIRSAEGKYGVADIAIIHVKEGFANDVMDSLELRKDDRINEFRKYDVYNSYSIAMNAEIFQEDELVVMLMLDEDTKANAHKIIDSYLP